MKRRQFLRTAAVTGLASPVLLDAHSELSKRPYKDNVNLSIIGFGGIVMMGIEQDHANEVVAGAIARGLIISMLPHRTETARRKRSLALHLNLIGRTFSWHVKRKSAIAMVRAVS
jgi:hypothetical protein